MPIYVKVWETPTLHECIWNMLSFACFSLYCLYFVFKMCGMCTYSLQNPKLLAALQESRKRQAPYAGAFLLKDDPEADSGAVSGSETEKNIYLLKGKELYDRLHEVGTLAQVCFFFSFSFFLSPSCIAFS